MTSKELKKLSRKELIELFLAQTRELESVKESLNAELEKVKIQMTHELDIVKKKLELSEQMVSNLKAERKLYQGKPLLMQEGQSEMDSSEDSMDETLSYGNTQESGAPESDESASKEDLPEEHMTSTGIRVSRL